MPHSVQVYKTQLSYKAGAQHGDLLEVHTRVVMESNYRAVFHQDVLRVEQTSSSSSSSSAAADAADPAPAKPKPLLLVSGQVELIYVDPVSNRPGKFPAALLSNLAAVTGGASVWGTGGASVSTEFGGGGVGDALR